MEFTPRAAELTTVFVCKFNSLRLFSSASASASHLTPDDIIAEF